MDEYRKYIITIYDNRNERMVIPKDNNLSDDLIYPDGCLKGTVYEGDFAFFKTKEAALKKLAEVLEFCRDCIYDDYPYVFQIEEVYTTLDES